MKRKGTYKKGLGLAQVIKEAKKSWHKRGGADEKPKEIDIPDMPMNEPPSSQEAGRRRRATRRHARKH